MHLRPIPSKYMYFTNTSKPKTKPKHCQNQYSDTKTKSKPISKLSIPFQIQYSNTKTKSKPKSSKPRVLVLVHA